MTRWPNGSENRPTISSAFGPRKATVAGASTTHRGCDFVGFSQVRAVASGTVKVVGTPSGWSGGGRQVWIQHDGYFTKSLHLASTAVKNGQWVNEGDIIGTMGMTGTAGGVHLHLELTLGSIHYSNSGQIDPVPFLAARISTGGDWPARARYGEAHVIALQNALRAVGYEIGVDGKDGPATQGAVRDYQGKNNLEVDGIGGPQTLASLQAKAAQKVGRNATSRPTADIQRLVGVTPDGVYGPGTTAAVEAWQRANGLEDDGVWGPVSDAKGFPAVVDEKLDVDGDRGPATIKALQRSLGFTGVDVDGELGPKTIAALQRAVGVDDDGELGPVTIKALQRSLGVDDDGDWGPATTRALQSLLNAGGKLHPVAAPAEPVVTAPDRAPASARTPVIPFALRGWDVPLNYRLNESKTAWVLNTRSAAIRSLIVHHTTNPGDEEPYFKTANSRSSAPTGYVRADGGIVEMIRPGLRPSATGSANDYSIALEVQNTTTAPDWKTSDAALETVARVAAWLASYDGKELDGVKVDFKLDRQHVIGHNEAGVNATVCPGPYIAPRLDSIVARAKVIFAAEYAPKPTPDPTPDPSDQVLVDRSKLQVTFDWIKKALGI